MRCLSVRQPFAELILSGEKRREYRSWRTSHRGPLLIHAGKEVDREALAESGLDADELPRGALVGVVDVVGCRRLKGGFAWVLESPRRLPLPIAWRGQVGLFNVEPIHVLGLTPILQGDTDGEQ
ncbi:MAG: ASCH domain-containing protein [Gemmataceae bacterium]